MRFVKGGATATLTLKQQVPLARSPLVRALRLLGGRLLLRAQRDLALRLGGFGARRAADGAATRTTNREVIEALFVEVEETG